ncbi:MAG: 3-phosphoshikimate 1-carboxyvinyltransferase [Chloroflexi bacterium]|nr:3-phosphoshikimate 1-carboxyvinyltransferase [Chloroflexota bacterium]
MGRTIRPSGHLAGTVVVPGDKSISHRAIIFNGLGEGLATIRNFLPGADCLSTVKCLRAMGVPIEIVGLPSASFSDSREGERSPSLSISQKGAGVGEGFSDLAGQDGPVTVKVTGRGLSGLSEPLDILDAGNSGTTMRLLSGVLAGQPFFSVLTGDSSLRSRPMGRVVEPLRRMGARIDGRKNGTLAPLNVRGGNLQSVHHQMPVASAQLKSAILLAGLFADGQTTALEPARSRDHTERLLLAMGAEVSSHLDPATGANSVSITRPRSLHVVDVDVPGDISSAAFWLVAGAIHPDAEICIPNVGVNPTRTGVLDVLEMMGARVRWERQRTEGGEPVADLRVSTGNLAGIEIKGELIPRLIDEIPVIAVAAALAKGKTIIGDAGELRVKESDRIETILAGLSRLGARVEALPDGMIIYGGARLRGAEVDSYGDHRLAMAFAVAGLAADGETRIQGSEAVDVSYPGFWKDIETLTSQG